jgi:NAD(P)H-nitrite reductase large subunit
MMSDLAAHVVILGAGHAGGTAAALLRQYGHEGPITLIGEEPIPPYQRPPLSKAWLKGEADADSLALKPLEFYAEHDIDFRASTTATATAFEGKAGRVTGVRLADGRVIACDAVVVGVGAHPNDELAKDAGLETARGVVVDLEARSSDANIFAIGDVAHRPMPIYGRMFRMESVPNAL